MDKQWSLWAYVTAGSTAFAGWVSLERAAMIIGIATALGTFVMNLWYKRKEYKLKEKFYERNS